MIQFPPLFRAWSKALFRPVALAWSGLVAVSLLALVAQVLVRVPLVPGPAGVGAVALGLLPEVGAMMLPVALFLGTLTVSRSWVLGGDMLALSSVGSGARRLIPLLVLIGVVGGAVVGTMSHRLAPAGRTLAREALTQAGAELRLEASRPTWVGDTLVRAEVVRGGALTDLFVAQGDVVAFAPGGGVEGDGVLTLHKGSARSVGAKPWSMEFDSLRIPLRVPPPRVHSFDLSNERLAGLIERMEGQGRSAHAERLVLLKRTTLALGTPLLVLLAFPIGARTRWPVAGAVGTIVGLWGVQRVGDHLAASVGAEVSAILPLVVLALCVVGAWCGWRER